MPISLLDSEEINRIYLRIARLLHPDKSPLTTENPELMDLFQNILMAYRANDLKAIPEAETLSNRFLKEMGEEPFPEKDNRIFSRLMDAGKLLMAIISKFRQKGSFTMISIGIYLVNI